MFQYKFITDIISKLERVHTWNGLYRVCSGGDPSEYREKSRPYRNTCTGTAFGPDGDSYALRVVWPRRRFSRIDYTRTDEAAGERWFHGVAGLYYG